MVGWVNLNKNINNLLVFVLISSNSNQSFANDFPIDIELYHYLKILHIVP